MNIAEIARRAGVSSAAVSGSFNDGYISEEKKAAIRRVVEGILSVVEGSGYQMLLAVTQNDPKKELDYLDVLDEKQVDGVILVGTVFTAEHKRMLKEMSVLVVIVGQSISGWCGVYYDDYHATYALTERILQLGRTRLGYIGAIMQDKAVGAERYRGFADAVKDKGHAELAEDHVMAAGAVQYLWEQKVKGAGANTGGRTGRSRDGKDGGAARQIHSNVTSGRSGQGKSWRYIK